MKMTKLSTPRSFPIIGKTHLRKFQSLEKLLALSVFASFFWCTDVHAQAFSGTYTFGASGNVTNFAYNGSPIANLTVGSLGKSNVTTSSSSGNFRATNWPLDPVVGSLTGVVDTNKYFEFTLSSSGSYTFDMTSLNFGFGRSATGTRSLQWRSSADNFASIITNYTSLGASGLFTNNAGELEFLTDNNTNGVGILLGFPASGYQALTTITFRCYMYNAEAAGGTAGLQGPFTFSGTLIAPVGGSADWEGTGLGGNWQDGTQGNFGAVYTNDLSSDVNFIGNAETVTVVNVVQAGKLTFDIANYVLEGGTLELGLGSITADNALTINSVLAGSAGMSKFGTGTLALGGANVFTGTVNISAGALAISADENLGAAANDLALAGSLLVTNTLALNSGRDLSGNATLNIAPGATLTVNGSSGLSSLTLPNTGTLALGGATNNPGSISATYSPGSALVSGTINFGSTDKSITVASNSTLELSGAITMATSGGVELSKLGAGTLILSGAGSSISRVQIGVAATNSTDGGVLRVADASGLGVQETYFNFGVIEPTTSISVTQSFSIAGRAASPAVFGGSGGNADLTIGGGLRFFGAAGTSGEALVNINNNTTIGGPITLAVNSFFSGWTVGGTGTLTIASASASTMTAPLTLADTAALKITGSVGGSVNLGVDSRIYGNGIIGGNLDVSSMAAGAGAMLFTLDNPANTNNQITVGGIVNVGSGVLGFSDFQFTNTAALDPFTYNLIISTNPISGTLDPADLTGTVAGVSAELRIFDSNRLQLLVDGGGVVQSNLVSFTNSSATVEESVGTFDITIESSYANGPVTGDLSLGGSALFGSDYSISATNFSMDAATTSATITVTVSNDALIEYTAETITLQITNVVGGELSTPATFTLTINPSDVPVFAPDAVWINEINYDSDASGDSNEFIEVAGPAGVDLSAYQLVLYNGGNSNVYNTRALTGVLTNQACELGAFALSSSNLVQNGAPDGVALVHVSGATTTLIQFLSYEGVMTATGGPANGVTSTDIGLTQVNDANTLQLSGFGTNYAAFTWIKGASSPGVINPAQVTILNFDAATATVAEASGSYTATVFKTTSSCSTTGDITGVVSVGGSATLGVDYTLATNITITGGSTSATVVVTFVDDITIESNETVVISLANLSEGGLITPSTVTLTITDNDQSSISFSTNAASISETGVTFEVAVFKSDTNGTVSSEIGISGTATNPDDFLVTPTNISLIGATTSATVTITILDNATDEPNRTVVLTLTNVAGAGVVSPSVFTLTIVDDDVPPPPADAIAFYPFTGSTNTPELLAVNATASVLTVSADTITYGSNVNWIGSGSPYALSSGGWTSATQAGAKQFAITINADSGYGVTITNVSFRTLATANGPSGLGVTINDNSVFADNAPTGSLPQVISLPISGYTSVASAVIGIQGWTNGSRATSGAGNLQIDDVLVQGFVTPTNAAPTPDISFALSSDTNSEAAGLYEVTVTKSPASGDVSGSITLGGTATEGLDYTVGTTNFTMNGPSTSAVFAITILNDSAVESSEEIIMTLTNVTGANIVAPSVFTLTITDNDVALPTNTAASAITFTSGQANVSLSAVTGVYYYLVYPNVPLAQITVDPVNVAQWDVADSEAPATNSPITLQDAAASSATGRVYGVLIRNEAIPPLP